jgi:hypothetical protein
MDKGKGPLLGPSSANANKFVSAEIAQMAASSSKATGIRDSSTPSNSTNNIPDRSIVDLDTFPTASSGFFVPNQSHESSQVEHLALALGDLELTPSEITGVECSVVRNLEVFQDPEESSSASGNSSRRSVSLPPHPAVSTNQPPSFPPTTNSRRLSEAQRVRPRPTSSPGYSHLRSAPPEGGITVDRVVSVTSVSDVLIVLRHLLFRTRSNDPRKDLVYLVRAENRYVKWLFLLERLRSIGDEELIRTGRVVPPLDVLTMWLTHLSSIRHYVEDIARMFDDTILTISPPLARIRIILEGPEPYMDASSAALWESFTGEPFILPFDDESPFVIACPTCTGTIQVPCDEYIRLKTEPLYDGVVCGSPEIPGCGTILSAAYLSALRFVNDFKGSLVEEGTFVAGCLLNPITGKPNPGLAKQIVQYLAQAPSVTDLYAAVVVPLPEQDELTNGSPEATSPTEFSRLRIPRLRSPRERSSPAPALSQNVQPWRDIGHVLFRLEVDLYALELEDHRLISWHLRAAIERMERCYRNLVTPLSLDLVSRLRFSWRPTATLLIAWFTVSGSSTSKAPSYTEESGVLESDESEESIPDEKLLSLESDPSLDIPSFASCIMGALPEGTVRAMNRRKGSDQIILWLPFYDESESQYFSANRKVAGGNSGATPFASSYVLSGANQTDGTFPCTSTLASATVRYHQMLLLQAEHAGLYASRQALAMDMILTHWTHLCYPPRYVRYCSVHFGRLVTYEFSNAQSWHVALATAKRRWQRRYPQAFNPGVRPRLSVTSRAAAAVDRVVSKLLSPGPL